MKIEQIIKSQACTIVDVRSRSEFASGHVAGSINAPLQEITEHIDELKKMQTPLILCCASGGRSGQAHGFLAQQGIECYNGGSWFDVNYFKTKTA